MRTMSARGGLRLLQMVSEPGTEQCASEDTRSPRGVDCEILHWLERGTKHSLKGYEDLSLVDLF